MIAKQNALSNCTLDTNGILKSARTVFEAESAALHQQASAVDERFVKAVHTILGCQGRLIVTGMGKSGHIARKIAATMASTGTPAYFVHPGEASHGDLGMILPEDAVIALSNSGESAELSDIIAYTRRFSIPLIGITSREGSTLAQASDVLLLLPQEPEVGALGLAPTTSTAMTLALGDALAVAVLECRGFTAEDFRNFHPGGKLGKTLQRVQDLMHKGEEIPLAKPSDPMASVLLTMTAKRLGCVGIVNDDGALIGIITDGDLRRHMDKALIEQTAATIMTGDPMTIPPRLLAAEALNILNEKQRTQVFIVDEAHKPIGILHLHDLLRGGIA